MLKSGRSAFICSVWYCPTRKHTLQFELQSDKEIKRDKTLLSLLQKQWKTFQAALHWQHKRIEKKKIFASVNVSEGPKGFSCPPLYSNCTTLYSSRSGDFRWWSGLSWSAGSGGDRPDATSWGSKVFWWEILDRWGPWICGPQKTRSCTPSPSMYRAVFRLLWSP